MLQSLAQREINPYSVLTDQPRAEISGSAISSERSFRRQKRQQIAEPLEQPKAKIDLGDLFDSLDKQGVKFGKGTLEKTQQRLQFFFRNGVKVHLNDQTPYRLELNGLMGAPPKGNKMSLMWVLILAMLLRNPQNEMGLMPEVIPKFRSPRSKSRSYRL